MQDLSMQGCGDEQSSVGGGGGSATGAIVVVVFDFDFVGVEQAWTRQAP